MVSCGQTINIKQMIRETQVKDKALGPGKGWHGDREGHARAGRLGGLAWVNPNKKKAKKAKKK